MEVNFPLRIFIMIISERLGIQMMRMQWEMVVFRGVRKSCVLLRKNFPLVMKILDMRTFLFAN